MLLPRPREPVGEFAFSRARVFLPAVRRGAEPGTWSRRRQTSPSVLSGSPVGEAPPPSPVGKAVALNFGRPCRRGAYGHQSTESPPPGVHHRDLAGLPDRYPVPSRCRVPMLYGIAVLLSLWMPRPTLDDLGLKVAQERTLEEFEKRQYVRATLVMSKRARRPLPLHRAVPVSACIGWSKSASGTSPNMPKPWRSP